MSVIKMAITVSANDLDGLKRALNIAEELTHEGWALAQETNTDSADERGTLFTVEMHKDI